MVSAAGVPRGVTEPGVAGLYEHGVPDTRRPHQVPSPHLQAGELG